MTGMVRKRKSSLFEDMIELTSKAHWAWGLGLALFSYVFLDALSGSGTPGKLNIIAMFATFGEIVLPIAFVLGSVLSFAASMRRRKVYFEAIDSNNLKQTLDHLTWREFEYLTHEYFRTRGYKVRETPEGPDGGVDLRLYKDGEIVLVQCKHWKASKVGVAIVRELYGVVASERASGGILVCSGNVTSEARAFADKNRIEIMDANRLAEVMGSYSGHEPTLKQSTPMTESISSPDCPRCGNDMVMRTAKKGANTGDQFWGCSAFPKCRGTRSLN